MNATYLLFCMLGVLLPWAAIGSWLAAHGFAFDLLSQQAVATPVSTFVWAEMLLFRGDTFGVHRQIEGDYFSATLAPD